MMGIANLTYNFTMNITAPTTGNPYICITGEQHIGIGFVIGLLLCMIIYEADKILTPIIKPYAKRLWKRCLLVLSH